MSDNAVAMCCVSVLLACTFAWHAALSWLRTRERCEEIRRNELDANVQDELIRRQAALEERLRKDVERVDAKVEKLNVAATSELQTMKREFDRFTAKDAASTHIAMGALQGRKF